MTAALLSELLLRQIPDHLIVGVRSGDYRVYGSVIRSLTSGRIVGHLQETSALTKVAGSLLGAPASMSLQAGGLTLDGVGHTVSFIQNEQIKSGIELLQSMQLANLVLSTVAIGISVAGFAALSSKLGRVEAKLLEIEPQLREIGCTLQAIRSDQLAAEFIRLRTTVEQLDEGWLLSEPFGQWRHVAAEAHYLSNHFQRRALNLIEEGPAALPVVVPMAEAASLAASARVTARMAAGDDDAAMSAAHEAATAMAAISERVRPVQSAIALVADSQKAASPEWSAAVQHKIEELRPVVGGIRGHAEAAAATVLTLQELESRDLSCRDWLDAARDENESVLLYLPMVAE